ncbi:hypothetical protein B0H13DRAFT_1862320 [Mycena leptocephala]|nr:hypothetical protein B0H13DRAFT_1862320 [Mycena leptocephala]
MNSGDSDDDVIAMGAPQDYDDDDVDGMIRAVAAEHPEAARKFLVKTPALMEKQSKALQTKAKRGAKRKSSSDLDSESGSKAKPKSKKKKSDDSDVHEPPLSITYYISIPKLPPVTSKKRGNGSKAADDDAIQKGPFSLPISQPYSALLSAIATALPCRQENINESKIVWKPKKPKNAEKLPLGKAAGYKVMITEMEEKAPGSRQVLLYMPAPAKPMEDETLWETNGSPEPTFDYSELEPTLPSDSIFAQKENFNKATKDVRAKLEERYPIGKYPQFPDRRVYHDPKTGFYYELNSTRLGIWLKVTQMKRHPVSKFFDANQRIKTIPTLPVGASAPTIPAPAVPSAPTVAGPALSFSDLLVASMFSQSSAPLRQPRSAPPSPVKRHTVSVDQFAEKYNLEDGDVALLKEVGFRPGDPTEATLDEELKRSVLLSSAGSVSTMRTFASKRTLRQFSVAVPIRHTILSHGIIALSLS